MRRIALALVVSSLAMAAMALPAGAQIDLDEPTSLAPLTELIGAVATGEPVDGLTVEGGGAVASHFQLLVNAGPVPVFFDRNLGVTPSSFHGGELNDLTEQLGPNLDDTIQVPPLHPGVASVPVGAQEGGDLSEAFAGWEAFDEFGPRTDPIGAVEPPTLMWGVEMAQPFDTSCASPSAVGRAWESQSLTSTNAPFDAGSLNELYPGTHDALGNGEFGRLIQLVCQGGQPIVDAQRMNPDLGRVRPFGPLDAIALVNGNHVVFLTTERNVIDSAADPTFFATGASGAVELGGSAGPIPVLVPDPYDAVPDKIRFIYDPASIQLIQDEFRTPPPIEGVQRDLLYRPGDQPAVIPDMLWRGGGDSSLVGVHCDVGVLVLHTLLADPTAALWGTQTSFWRETTRDGDVITSSATYPDGSSDTVVIDLASGEFRVELMQGPNADSGDCIIEGTIEIAGAGTDAAPPASGTEGDDDGATGSDGDGGGGEPPAGGDGDDGDGGGGSTVLILGVVGAAIIGIGVTIASVRRRGKPPAPPEPTSANEDGFLLEGLAGLGRPKDDDPEDASSTSSWTSAESRELAAQDEIKKIQSEAVADWNRWYGRYRRAMSRWATASASAWTGAGELMENQEDFKQTQVVTQAIDMAYGLIQLGRGLLQLGTGALGWLKAKRAITGHAGRTARAAAEEAFRASPTLTRFADSLGGAGGGGLKTFRDELIEAVMWGQDAGIDVVPIMTAKLDELTEMGFSGPRLVRPVIESVVRPVMKANGLTFAPSHVADAVQGVSGALARFGRGQWLNQQSADAVADFVRMVDDTPNFWDDAGNMMIDFGKAEGDQFTGEMADLVTPDGLNTLRALYDAAKEAGDDFTLLHHTFIGKLGPAKATAMEFGERAAMNEGIADMVLGAREAQDRAESFAGSAIRDEIPDEKTGSIGDVSDHTGQFGITSDSVLGGLWDIFNAPVETAGGVYHSYVAQDGLIDLMETHADDMSEMSQAWSEMVNALDGLIPTLQDSSTALGTADALDDALGRLEAAQADLRSTFEGAPQAWQNDMQKAFDEKWAHIEQKKKAIRRLRDGLRDLSRRLESMRAEMRDAMASHDGDRRSALEWIDADMSALVTRVSFELEAINSHITATD